MPHHLILHRRGVPFHDDHVGPVIAIPPVPDAETLATLPGPPSPGDADADRSAILDALLAVELAQLGRVSAITLHGLHEPSAWEQAVIDHLAGRFDVTPERPDDPEGPFRPLGQTLLDPLGSWPTTPPAGVQTCEADDTDLEALAGVRWLRDQLNGVAEAERAAFLDEVLILVPDDPARLEAWAAHLEEAGIPAQRRAHHRLLEGAVGSWFLSLARLCDSGPTNLRREDLHALFDAPLYRMPNGARRADLRAILRELRRPSLHLDALRTHAQAWFQRRARTLDPSEDDAEARRDDLEARKRGVCELIDGLGGLLHARPTEVWSAILSFTGADQLALSKRLGAAGAAELVQDVAKVRSVLRDLRDASVQPQASVASTLHDALEGLGGGDSLRLAHGVRLESWSCWSGEGAQVVLLTGLEDGGFPTPPAPLSDADARVWSGLGLMGATGKPAVEELQRQTRVLARAASSAQARLWISWSNTDASGGTTFPGAPLAGRPNPKPKDDNPWNKVHTHLAERDLLPDADATWIPAELQMLPAPVGADDDHPTAAREARAEHHRAVAAARRPHAEGTAVGPYTGRLEVPVPGEAWSAGALEDLGQCGTKFFLQRVLRAERDEDAGTYLDALETGSLVHDAFAHAALDAIAQDGVWRLQGIADDPPHDAQAQVREALSAQEQRTRSDHPTLGAGIVHWTARRWQQAADRAFAAEAAQPAPFFGREDLDPMTMGEEDLRVLAKRKTPKTTPQPPTLIKNLIAAREVYAERLAEAEAIDSQPFTAKTAKEAAVVSQSQLLSAGPLKLSKELARDSLGIVAGQPGSLTALITDKMNELVEKTQLLVDAQVKEDESSVTRAVYAAEWAFGLPPFPGDDAPTDPRSGQTAQPLALDFDNDLTLKVKGRVDRVDADPATGRLVTVDYKTGTRRGPDKLSRQFADGRHLQLPLYGRAAATLLAPLIGHVEGTPRAVAGRLQFPRTAAEASLPFAGTTWQPHDSDSADPSDPLTADDVLDAHLAHSAQRLATGTLPLVPRACPLLRHTDAWCPFEASCGFDPTAKALADDAPQPRFAQVVAESERSGSNAPPALTAPAAMKPSDAPPPTDSAKAAQAEAEAQVLNLDRDVVVSAGAGSGKTTQLIRRYAAAITQQDIGPDQILAITFTRKATAEMRSRVRVALRKAAQDQPDLRPKLRHHLLALGTAPILTIDAFAQRVVTALAPDAATKLQVTPDLRPYTESWLDGRLADATGNPGPELNALLDRLPLAGVRKHLLALLSLDTEALNDLATLTPDALVHRWRDGLEAAWPELPHTADALTTLGSDHFEGVEATSASQIKHLKRLRAEWPAARALIEQQGTIGMLAALKSTLSLPKMSLSPSFEQAYEPIKQAITTWARSDRPTYNLAKRLAGDDAPPTPEALHNRLHDEAAATLGAVQLAASWRSLLDKDREKRQLVGYGDLMRRATALLNDRANDADVRANFPFAHVFVDELQDTNRAQHDLIDALCESLMRTAGEGAPPRRFLVGDVKQSIYRFRGAEVDGFQALLAEAKAKPDTEVAHLGACWRAHPRLTAAVDRLFERILDPIDADGQQLDPAAAVPWEPLAPRWPDDGQEPDSDDGPRVELLGEVLFENQDHAEEDGEQGSLHSPGEFSDDVDDDEEDSEEIDGDVAPVVSRVAEVRQAHPGQSIALLTHSWAQAERWGGHLQDAGIPAFVQGGRGLLKHPTITPLLQVLHAMEREDSLGMLEVLRGPLVGLSDPGLLAIRHAQGVTLPGLGDDAWVAPSADRLRLSSLRRGFCFDATKAQTWLDSLGEAPLSPAARQALVADAERVADFTNWWPALRRRFGIVPLHQTLSELIAHTDYRRLLYADASVHADAPSAADLRLRLAALRRFQSLVRALCAEHGDAVSVIRALRRLADEDADPAGASNPFPGDAVTVTVVHQAKGLAWDHVFLPTPRAAKPKSRVHDAAAVRALVGGQGSLLPLLPETKPSDPFATQRSLSGELVHLATLPAERAENRRLLYVACTRARERLFVHGPLPAHPHEARKLIEKLQKVTPLRGPSLRVSRSWAEDITLAIGFDVEGPPDNETWSLRKDAWEAGRDFILRPPADAAAPTPTDDLVRTPRHSDRHLAPVVASPITVVHPSSIQGQATAAEPTGTLTAQVPEMAPAPFPPRQAGTLLHHALATYGWKPEPPTDAHLRDAIGANLSPHLTGDARERVLGDALPWLRELLRRAIELQPDLTARLQDAAARGALIHEARIQVPMPNGHRLEGFIDLLWQDPDGTWHLLDYKLAEPGTQRTLDDRIASYYAQVRAYADALRPTLTLNSYGLWFLAEGAVVWWDS